MSAKEAAQQVTIEDGPYANSKMLLLNPELDTIDVTDQLHRLRSKTRVPVALQFKQDEPPYPCVLVDFSESAVRLRSSEFGHFRRAQKAKSAGMVELSQQIHIEAGASRVGFHSDMGYRYPGSENTLRAVFSLFIGSATVISIA